MTDPMKTLSHDIFLPELATLSVGSYNVHSATVIQPVKPRFAK